MGLDIRTPLGYIFAVLGGILMVYGMATNSNSMYAVSGGLNLNLIWGSLMLAFGMVMILKARLLARSRRAPPTTHTSSDTRADVPTISGSR
jgi:membrane-bound ClpP family serine protease